MGTGSMKGSVFDDTLKSGRHGWDEIEKEAKKHVQEIIDLFKDAYERGEPEALSSILEYELAGFNEITTDIIMDAIYEEIGNSLTKDLDLVPITPIKLSDMLYYNLDKLQNQVDGLLKILLANGKTMEKIGKKLYDGYGLDKILKSSYIRTVPRYAISFRTFSDEFYEDFINNIEKIKTLPYKTAMLELEKAVSEHLFEEIEKALENIMEEKKRYFAMRIAKTEIQRAKMLVQANDMLNDPDIEFVKWELSSQHKIFDICDYHANYDYGFGEGIYKKCDYPAIPLHPFCMCKVVPYYHDIKRHSVQYPVATNMSKYTDDEKRKIVGSWDKLNQFENGKPLIDIWNEARPKYPITSMCEAIDKLKANPLVEQRVRDLQREINAQIQKYGDFNNLDYSMMDTGDRDLTRLQRLKQILEQIEEDKGLIANGDEIGFAPSFRDVRNYKQYWDDMTKYGGIKPQVYLRDETVMIYRSGKGPIEAGDWIALTKEYAEGHNYDGLDDLYKMAVSWDDVRWAGADFNEWIYVPQWTVKAYEDGLLNFNKIIDVYSLVAPLSDMEKEVYDNIYQHLKDKYIDLKGMRKGEWDVDAYHGDIGGKRQNDFYDDMFFTNKPEYADQYAGRDTRYWPNRKNPDGTVGYSEEIFQDGGYVTKARFNTANFKTISKASTGHDPEIEKLLIQQAKDEGYSGLEILYEGSDRIDYVVFYSDTIKYPYENLSGFDIADLVANEADKNVIDAFTDEEWAFLNKTDEAITIFEKKAREIYQSYVEYGIKYIDNATEEFKEIFDIFGDPIYGYADSGWQTPHMVKNEEMFLRSYSPEMSTFYHEYGHGIDFSLGVADLDKYFSTQYSSFTNAFYENSKVYQNMITFRGGKPAISIAYDSAMQLFLSKGGDKAYKGYISDIFDAMNKGMIYDIGGNAGHGSAYFSRHGNDIIETFANLFALKVSGNWEATKALFPELTKAFDKIYNDMIRKAHHRSYMSQTI